METTATASDAARIEQDLAAEEEQSDMVRFRTVTLSVVCGFVLALSVDYLVAPDKWLPMAITRSTIAVVLLGLWRASKEEAMQRHALRLSLALFLVAGVGIVACALVLGRDVGFHDALEIAYMVYAAFLPTTLPVLLGASTFLTAVYAVSVVALDVSTGGGVVSSIVFLLVLAQAIAVGFVFSNNRLKQRGREARIREGLATLSLQRANVELSDTSRLLRESNASKSRYFAHASHELRTPLTLMLTALEAIEEHREEALLPPLYELRPCHQHGLRLLRLINDILSLSRMDTGRVFYRVADFDFVAMISRLVEETRLLAGRKAVAIRIEAPPGLAPPTEGDVETLERALLNVLGIALEAAVPGSEVVLSITTEPAESAVRVAVETEAADAPRLAALAAALGGPEDPDDLAFDLSVSKRVIRAHRGHLSLTLDDNRRADFVLRLPRACQIDEAVRDRRQKTYVPRAERRNDKGLDAWDAAVSRLPAYRLLSVESRLSPAEATPAEGDVIKPTALIIEPNRDIVDLLASALGDDISLIHVKDADTALARARQAPVDLVISDLVLPGKSGLDTAHLFRQDFAAPPLPFILLADHEPLADAARGAPIDAWLGKPFSTKAVRTTVRRLLSRKLEKSQFMREERDTSLRLLADGIAHEILNPVGFIQGAADILERLMAEALSLVVPRGEEANTIERDAKEFFGSIRAGVERTRGSIAELRKFSRSEGGAERTLVRVNEAVDSALNISRLKGSVRLELTCDSAVSMVKGQLDQVVLNLLINAVQAGGPDCVITVTTGEAEATGEVVIRVQDQGPGMDADTLAKIFDPYFTTKERGTGLGLPLCRKILREAEGEIAAESSPGRGTTMTIRLPLALFTPAAAVDAPPAQVS